MWESFLGPHNTTFKPGKDDVQVLRFCKILNVNGVPFESHQRCLPALLPPRVWKKSVGRGSELLAICACNVRAIHDYFGSWTLLLKDQNTSSYLSLYNSKRWPQSCPCSESYGFSGSKMICIFLNWQHQSPFLILLLFFFFFTELLHDLCYHLNKHFIKQNKLSFFHESGFQNILCQDDFCFSIGNELYIALQTSST